jgi:hypothetical protein
MRRLRTVNRRARQAERKRVERAKAERRAENNSTQHVSAMLIPLKRPY